LLFNGTCVTKCKLPYYAQINETTGTCVLNAEPNYNFDSNRNLYFVPNNNSVITNKIICPYQSV